MKYRKKPVVIEAWKWNPQLQHDYQPRNWPSWLQVQNVRTAFPDKLEIETLEGTMTADKGDWIICGIKGEIYPCKPDIFEATYEKVE